MSADAPKDPMTVEPSDALGDAPGDAQGLPGPAGDAPSPVEAPVPVPSAMRPSPDLLDALQERLGYLFRDRERLVTALTHKSWANEQGEGTPHNERLEFLGDAVFSLVVGHLLMHRYAEVDEGVLSKARSALVSATALADLGASLDIGPALRLGRGEARTGGREKPSILADACEAVAAAIYLDGGFEVAFGVLGRLLRPRLEPALQGLRRRDPKTHLQERIQALTKRPPTYTLKDTSGPEHDLRFTVVLQAAGRDLAVGVGRTKKDAEQAAAAEVLTRLRAGESLNELLGLAAPEEPSSEPPPRTGSGPDSSRPRGGGTAL